MSDGDGRRMSGQLRMMRGDFHLILLLDLDGEGGVQGNSECVSKFIMAARVLKTAGEQ